MEILTTVFQFEIRFNHILNFPQIAKKILSPFVRLANSIKIDNQNTIEERIVFNFEDDDYLIIISWDRILIRGQGDLTVFTSKNSPIETPFLSILQQIKNLEEFGEIKNSLYAVNFIKKLDIPKEELVDSFINKTVTDNITSILNKNSDIAITLEEKQAGEEYTVSFGPYFGTEELMRRPLIPINLANLGDTDFSGIMVEYKHFKHLKQIDFSDFIKMTEMSNKILNKVWEIL